MEIDRHSERKIIDSWHKNAAPWIVAIEEQQIESRRLVTDRSIVDAVISRNGKTVLDLGCGDLPYIDGWRCSSWCGFSPEFTDPPPWYFRTLATWVNLFVANELSVVEIRKPKNPQTGEPAAAIFIGRLLTDLVPKL